MTSTSSDDEEMEQINANQMDTGEMGEEGDGKEKKGRVYIPGVSRDLKSGEEWDFDESAYRIYHSYETDLPCLSFDIIGDALGENRTDPPLSFQLVCGTQAASAKNNELCITRFSNIHALRSAKKGDGDDESSSSSSDESDDEDGEEGQGGSKGKRSPIVHSVSIPHYGDINRVKFAQLGSAPVCAVWNDQNKANKRARVQVWNLSAPLARIDSLEENDNAAGEEGRQRKKKRGIKDGSAAKGRTEALKMEGSDKPMFTYSGHTAAGFALGWSPLKVGALASGDMHSKVHLWAMKEAGEWEVSPKPLSAHQQSVEDVQWSPAEEALLVSCSCDSSIRLWDTRSPPKEACVCCVDKAHEGDVNVLSWNADEPLIVSGGDDGALKVWSLKTIQYKQPVALFRNHSKPITSVEWNPNESTVLMASGEDDKVTMWDLALEADTQQQGDDDGEDAKVESSVPPQLLFVHMGQKEIKEVHWHKQIPGLAVTTALEGFNIFRTVNI